MVRDAKFATVLINWRLKSAYTWYKLRCAVEQDFTGIKEIVRNKNSTELLERIESNLGDELFCACKKS